MISRLKRTPLILLLGFTFFIIAYWLIPIPGQVLLVPDNWQQINAWPQVRLDETDLRPSQKVSLSIYDTVPWPYVKLVVGDEEGTLESYQFDEDTAVTRWIWTFTVPETAVPTLNFYHDCHTGCQTWTTVNLGAAETSLPETEQIPTKLGVVFPNPERDWHNRRGWVVELTYAQLSEADYWGIDDLASRVRTAADKGLLVLVRVDYDQGQSIPPADDFLALDSYLSYLKRLARDDRLQPVYGYVIGSGFNTDGANSQSPANKVTPAWYARVFNGYGAAPEQSDNVVQTIRNENQAVRVLVGPVSPWRADQDGERTYQIDVPWLNYFNTLAAAIDQAAQDKTAVGVALAAPDGFALQAPGRPDAPEVADDERANEPRTDLQRPSWNNAQAGFRVYRDWLAVINAYPSTKGLPVYITAANTFQPDSGVEPAQNYPPGWLTAAVAEINAEPQVAALIWFLDLFPHDDQWDFFSLTNPRGQMVDAANEFDALLQLKP